jgi:heme-degrading monooxygenase HmoA
MGSLAAYRQRAVPLFKTLRYSRQSAAYPCEKAIVDSSLTQLLHAGCLFQRKIMIIRTWRAIAANQNVVDTYGAHLERNTFREMRTLDGHIGASMSARQLGDKFEILFMSYWRDMDAVRQFAHGEDIHRAVVKESTQKLLDSFDSTVEYFEVQVKSGAILEQSAS